MDARRLNLRRTEECLVAVMPDEIDLSNADQIGEYLLGLAHIGRRIMIVDMSATAFCGVAGVHAIKHAHQRARAHGGDLRLVTDVPLVRRVFSITGADRVVRIYPDRASAWASASGTTRPDDAAANVLGVQFLTLPVTGADGRLTPRLTPERDLSSSGRSARY